MLNPEPFDVREAVSELRDIFQNKAIVKQLVVTFFYDGFSDKDYFIKADKARFQQIVLTLMANAYKLTIKDQIQVVVKYENHIPKSTAGRLVVTVINRGTVIDNKETFRLNQLLMNSQRPNDLGNSRKASSLQISNLLAHQMNGSISFTYHEEMGATFEFSLALKELEKDQVEHLKQNQEQLTTENFNIDDQ